MDETRVGRLRSPYIMLCVKTVIVTLILLLTWAFEGHESAPVYMRF